MQYRAFGRTGWQVSEIAFGAWQLGGDWGRVDDEASIATLHHAFERGVNFVDTAELYGRGHSEEVVGRALKQWRGGKIYVATKAQPDGWPDATDDTPSIRGKFSDQYLRSNVEQSLRRLGVERIDLYQLHSWMPDGIRVLQWLETLQALQKDGKIDRIGVSLRDFRPDEGVELAASGLVDSLQVVFNLFEQRPAAALFPAGAASSTGFIARVPLDSGALVGNWHAGSYAGWEAGSQPHQMFRGERFGETLGRVEKLKAVTSAFYPTLAEAAMRFVLSAEALSTVIPGMKNKAEVDMNVAYSDGAEFPSGLARQLPEHGWIRDYYR